MIILKIDTIATVLSFVFLIGCSTTGKMEKSIKKRIEEDSFFVGLNVVNLETGEEIIDYQGTKLFTPASNVKLFTLYAALQSLPDTVSSFDYSSVKDSLILRGTANPVFLSDSMGYESLNFLKNADVKVFVLDEEIEDEIYGPGWSWEDYNRAYMPERSLFPIYGNTVLFRKENDDIEVVPSMFEMRYSDYHGAGMDRLTERNEFFVNSDEGDFEKRVPFKTSNQLLADLLSEELDAKVTLLPTRDNDGFKPFKEIPYDSLYVRMIRDSNNFIAEQLLLQVSNELTGVYNSQKGIAHVLDSMLIGIPQKPRWVDGSGLSRYNLFSPQSMVHVLRLLYENHDRKKVLSYFPRAGEEGTLKNDYEGLSFVQAKSGSLSNNYCLSGYLTTKKGTVLAFSYMNNHYLGASSSRKKEMISVLTELYEQF